MIGARLLEGWTVLGHDWNYNEAQRRKQAVCKWCFDTWGMPTKIYHDRKNKEIRRLDPQARWGRWPNHHYLFGFQATSFLVVFDPADLAMLMLFEPVTPIISRGWMVGADDP